MKTSVSTLAFTVSFPSSSYPPQVLSVHHILSRVHLELPSNLSIPLRSHKSKASARRLIQSLITVGCCENLVHSVLSFDGAGIKVAILKVQSASRALSRLWIVVEWCETTPYWVRAGVCSSVTKFAIWSNVNELSSRNSNIKTESLCRWIVGKDGGCVLI